MSNAVTMISFRLVLAAIFLALSTVAQAGEHESNRTHEHKDVITPAHCEDTMADAEAALIKFWPLAAKGDAQSQFELGFMYERGRGVPQDYKESASWFRKSAEQGNASAQFYLGQMYDIGKGVPQDYQEAAMWYRKSAEQGGTLAQLHLGFLYDFGQGVPADKVQAYKWYSLAAVSGNEIAPQRRKVAEARMAQQEIRKSEVLVNEWLAQHK